MSRLNEIEALEELLISRPSYLTIIKEIEKDLDRLENLEKAIDILKDNLYLYKGLFNCLSINGGHEYSELTNQEYELLKEVFGDD